MKAHLDHLRSQQGSVPQRDALGQVLDDLNAWGYLEEQQQTRHDSITCYGPGVFRGYLPLTWAAVTIWYKQRGYYYYDHLYLLGIWAMRSDEDTTQVIVGQRVLDYELPFFNPDSYYRRIQEEYRIFYKDSGAPPTGENQRYSVTYDPAARLDIRREIEDALRLWAIDLKRPW